MSSLPRLLLPAVVVLAGTTASAAYAQRPAKPPTAPAAAPAATRALTATAATKAAVSLTWDAGPAGARTIVERKALGASWPVGATAAAAPAPATAATIATLDDGTATYTDAAIDPFATYVYRVRALGAGGALSAPSAELTVGPPPVGFSSVLAAPRKSLESNPANFGAMVRSALDRNGDPLIAFIALDPNADGEPDDSELWTIHWSRALYRWLPAVKVEVVGGVNIGGSRFPLAVATDGAGAAALLYTGVNGALRLARSADDGLTWTTATVAVREGEQAPATTPALALDGATVHAAWSTGVGGTAAWATGALTADPATWTRATAPKPPNTAEGHAECTTIALDAARQPVVGFCMNDTAPYTVSAWAWRPATGALAKVLDTGGHQTDDPSLAFTARGARLAAVFQGARDDRFFKDHHLWHVASSDGGATWGAVDALTDDGGDVMGAPVTLVLDAAGRTTIAAPVGGGSAGNPRCGLPKLIRGTTGAFTTCAPDLRAMPGPTTPLSPALVLATNDKAYLAFATRAAANGLPAGLVLWREK